MVDACGDQCFLRIRAADPSDIDATDKPSPLHHTMSMSISLLHWYRPININISPVQSPARSYHSLGLLLLVLPGHVLEIFYLALGTRQHFSPLILKEGC